MIICWSERCLILLFLGPLLDPLEREAPVFCFLFPAFPSSAFLLQGSKVESATRVRNALASFSLPLRLLRLLLLQAEKWTAAEVVHLVHRSAYFGRLPATA